MIARFQVIKNNRNEAESLDTASKKVTKNATRALVLQAVESKEGESKPWADKPNGVMHVGGLKDIEADGFKIGDEVLVEIRKP